MSRRRKILLAILGVLVLMPSLGVYWVVTTESGLRFLVNRLHKAGPVTLTAGEITGTLTQGIRISTLRIEHRLSDIRIEDAAGRVRLLPLLLRRQIDVPQFTARSISIIQLHDPIEREKRTPRFLPAMLRIDTDALRVDALTLTLKNGRQLAFSGISARGTVLPQQIRVRQVELDWEDRHVIGNGRVHAARPYGLEGELDVLWSPANQPQWRIAGKFDGDLADLPLTAEVTEPFNASVTGNAVLQSDWRLAGRAVVRDFAVEDFGGSAVLGHISGELALTANREGFTAKGQVTPPGLHAGPFNVDFSGRYQEKRLDIRNTVIVHPESGTRATLRGTVALEPDGPRLAINGNWTQLRWPLVAPEPAFTSAQGTFVMEGVKPWQVRAQGEVIAADLPPMPASVRGRLGAESFLIDEGTLELFGGTAQFKGDARWKPAEGWQVEGRMTGLDPSHLREDLPGDLNFNFTARGAPFGAAGTIELDVANLDGELRGRDASGKGTFSRAGGSTDWQFKGVDFTLGTARLQLDGGLGARSDLTFALQASDLSLLDAEARGSLNASGRFAGTRAAPLLKLSARGSAFEWKGYKVARLDADLDIDVTTAPGRAEGSVAATGLTFGARTIDSVSFALTGSGEQQRLALLIEADPVSAQLAAQGGIRDGLWQGELISLGIDQKGRGPLRNETSAALAFNLRQVELGQVCLKGAQERLCAGGRRLADGTWNANFSADSLPLATFTAGMSQQFDYDGTIGVRGELAGRSGALPTGSVQAELMEARLRHRLGNGREETMSLGTGTVSATATAEAFAFQVSLDAAAAGSIKGRLDGQRTDRPWRDYPIRGSLAAETDGLSLLDIYIGEIDRATGLLTTSVNIGGTLGAPTLEGTLQIRDASIDIYRVNLALREVSLDARFDTNALDISGKSMIGGGAASFNGRLAWRDGQPFGDLHLEGERLLVVNVPEARIQASPNLDFKIEGRTISATGEVLVPYGRIEPADLTTAVLASGDEVLVGAPAIDPAQRWTVVSDISLRLGNDVRVETLGLAAQLGGALQLRTDVSGNTRAQGELTVSNGQFSALGRELEVQNGRLIYANAPLGDPGIELRAQKVLPDVTAGVLVRGTLRNRRLSYYSEPSLPPTQIVSLILAGGSLESLRDAQAPGAARNDLLAQGTAIFAQRVGGRVGLDNVGIESGSGIETGADQTSLVLGKYLSPRLFISYGISLTETINTLKLRWTINDRWTIRTEAGEERAADIVFTLKK